MSTRHEPVLAVSGVTYRYPHRELNAIDGIDLRIDEGEIVALLGPNGSGKSTLMRLFLGALRPDTGSVALWGRDVTAWPRDEVARRIGVVTQAEDLAFPLAVREMVAMGRYPHIGAWRRESEADAAAITQAMQRCGVLDLSSRSVLELSGGERQRVRVARALAQEPRALLLDEPSASLDIAHEMSLFELLAELHSQGVTVVVVTHNINIASRYADRLVLLDRGQIAATGSPAQVLTRDTVESVYEWPVTIRYEDDAPQVIPRRVTGTHTTERRGM